MVIRRPTPHAHGQELIYGFEELVTLGTAGAAILQFYLVNLVLRALRSYQQLRVDIDFGDIVNDEANFQSFLVLQKVPEKGGLPGAKEARQHKDRNRHLSAL
mmetsp:Transcript_5079/g.18483  ORF Transcript_5079/g.18483 Transcript_5079/m.18483 type:complete len:102 (-) Transcript_5079:20-325(-)